MEARGWWSLLLTLGYAVVYVVVGLAVLFGSARILGGMIAMLVAAVVLGVGSIVGARRGHGRPGSTIGIVLGCIGIVLSAAMGFYLLLPVLPI